MANVTELLQGAALSDFFETDLTDVGTLDAVKIEVGLNGSTVLDYRYPEVEDYPVVSKDGNTYSISLTSEQTATMRGKYEIEVTGYLNGSQVFKNNYSQNGDCYLEIKTEIK